MRFGAPDWAFPRVRAASRGPRPIAHRSPCSSRRDSRRGRAHAGRDARARLLRRRFAERRARIGRPGDPCLGGRPAPGPVTVGPFDAHSTAPKTAGRGRAARRRHARRPDLDALRLGRVAIPRRTPARRPDRKRRFGSAGRSTGHGGGRDGWQGVPRPIRVDRRLVPLGSRQAGEAFRSRARFGSVAACLGWARQ